MFDYIMFYAYLVQKFNDFDLEPAKYTNLMTFIVKYAQRENNIAASRNAQVITEDVSAVRKEYDSKLKSIAYRIIETYPQNYILFRDGRHSKIESIKKIRHHFELSLKDALDVYENYREDNPPKTDPPPDCEQ